MFARFNRGDKPRHNPLFSIEALLANFRLIPSALSVIVCCHYEEVSSA